MKMICMEEEVPTKWREGGTECNCTYTHGEG